MFKPHSDNNIITCDETVLHSLNLIRKARNFDSLSYMFDKVIAIDKYVRKHNISTLVIGISGGIDSAVCYELLIQAKELTNSPIKNIVPICLTAGTEFGVHNDIEHFVSKLIPESLIFDMNTMGLLDDFYKQVTMIFDSYRYGLNALTSKHNITDDNMLWAKGQSVAHMRTMILAAINTWFTAIGYKSIIIGTTNKDEYSVIGYFGKYSDGLTDLQIISDLHKSEVYQLGELLHIPNEIMERSPTGDMYVDCTDEQVFGVSYDMLEYITTCITFPYFPMLADKQVYKAWERVRKLNKDNAHKYAIGIPCVTLDILPSGGDKGRELNLDAKYYKHLKNMGDYIKPCFVNPIIDVDFSISASTINHRNAWENRDNIRHTFVYGIDTFNNCMSEQMIKVLTSFFNKHIVNYTKTTNEHGKVDDTSRGHSQRLSLYNEYLSELLWEVLKHSPILEEMSTRNIPCDHDTEVWIPIGINPLFRFINYINEGELVAHYDFPFEDRVIHTKTEVKSLFSVILYINVEPNAGTVFFEDPQHDVDWKVRDIDDFSKEETSQLPTLNHIIGKTGDIAIFPHYNLHGSSACSNKLIVRTDIMFERLF